MPQVETARATPYDELHDAGRDAPAVVFAHGSGRNTPVWWQQVPHFARTCRVLAFDHRGFGRSRCAPEHFHAREFADELSAILDHAGNERAAAVCQSMGGWSALPFALARPDRIGALVLIGTPAGVPTPKVREACATIGRTTPAEGIRGSPALASHFPQRTPALACLYERIGAQDGLFPPAALHEAAAAIPRCRIVDFPDSGHSPYFEDAARFNEVVAAFRRRD
jgi:3-oxoadipate enol-lactonase